MSYLGFGGRFLWQSLLKDLDKFYVDGSWHRTPWETPLNSVCSSWAEGWLRCSCAFLFKLTLIFSALHSLWLEGWSCGDCLNAKKCMWKKLWAKEWNAKDFMWKNVQRKNGCEKMTPNRKLHFCLFLSTLSWIIESWMKIIIN